MNNKPRFVGEKATLEGRIEYVRGVTYKAASDLHQELDESSYVLFRANNIQDGKLTFDDVQFVDRSKVKQKQLLRKGDILVCASSGSKGLVGKAALVSEDVTATFGAFCCVLRANGCDPRYLAHYFQSSQYRSAIETLCTGSNINNLKAGNFNSLFVPRYQEQDELLIVERLDEIQAQISLAKAQLSKLDQLVKSRFVEMFGDLKLNVNGWPVEAFDSFATIDTHMTNDLAAFSNKPHIGIDSIESGSGRLSGYRTVAEDGIISGKYPFTAEHIIYSKIRPALNKVALPDFDGVCSADAYPILPREGKCGRIYLAQVMRSAFFLDYVLPLSGRAQMPKVNKKALQGFSMPVPPIELQNQFSAFVAQVDKPRFARNRMRPRKL